MCNNIKGVDNIHNNEKKCNHAHKYNSNNISSHAHEHNPNHNHKHNISPLLSWKYQYMIILSYILYMNKQSYVKYI